MSLNGQCHELFNHLFDSTFYLHMLIDEVKTHSKIFGCNENIQLQRIQSSVNSLIFCPVCTVSSLMIQDSAQCVLSLFPPSVSSEFLDD